MLSRRDFLTWLAGALPVAAVVRRAHIVSMSHLVSAPATLDALGVALLPSELGMGQIGRVVVGFRHWIDGYRENVEINHAYGNSRLRFTGPTPATRWTKQLDDLDAAATTTHGSPFAALTVTQRQQLIRPLLVADRGIPGSPEGASHVALALLAFFYASPAATDLCYEAAIGKTTCRPLGESSRHPLARAR